MDIIHMFVVEPRIAYWADFTENFHKSGWYTQK